MMAKQVDGSLILDTSIDTDGINKGLSSISSLATRGIVALTTAVSGLSAYAFNVGSSFEEGMSGVAAISGATGDELKKLEDTAKELGAKTKFSASEATEAMTNLAAAGFTTNEIIDATGGLMNLAAASGEDLASSTDIAASTLRGFGLDASKTAHVADVLAENANRTNAAVADTGEAMKYVAPVAKAMGISFEETSAAIGIMANSGIKGSQAGTTLRGALTRLVKPTGDMVSTMEDLGVEFFDAQGNMKPLKGIIKELEKGTKELTSQQKNQALTTLFGQEALSGMLSLVDGGADQLEDLTQSYIDCDGSAQAMADTMNDNLAGQITILGSSLEGLGIAAYEKFEGPMKEAVDASIEEINQLSDAMGPGGELEGSMVTLADHFGDIVEGVIGFGTDAIPVLIDGFNFVVDNIDIITLGIGTLGSAYLALAAHKKIDTAVTLINTAAQEGSAIASALQAGAIGVLNGQISIATATQSVFNAVLSACPWVQTALLVGGTVAVLGGLYLALNNNADEYAILTDKMEENRDAYIDLQEKEAESVSTKMTEIDRIQDLKDELDVLIDANGRVRDGYEDRVAFITNELNDACDTEIKIVDGVIENYDELSEAIDRAIIKQRLEAVVSGMQTIYEDMEEQQEIALGNMLNAEKQYDKARAETIDKRNKMIANGFSETEMAMDDYYQELLNKEDIQKKAYDEAVQTFDNYTYWMLFYNEAQTASLSDNTGKQQEILDNYSNFVVKNGEIVMRSEEDRMNHAKETYDSVNRIVEKGDKYVTDAMIESAEKQLQTERDKNKKLIQEYSGQAEKYFNTSIDNMEQLIEGLESKDPEVQGKAIATAKEMIKNLKGKDDSFYQTGADALQGFINGMNSKESSLYSVAWGMVNKMMGLMKGPQGLDEHSPSKALRKIGSYGILGLIKGFEDESDYAINTAFGIVQSIRNAFSQSDAFQLPVIESANSLMSGIGYRTASSYDMNSYTNTTDYEAIGKEVAKAIGDSGIRVEVGRREFGRLVNEVI